MTRTDDEIRRLADAGKGQRTIAAALGVSRWRVRRVLAGAPAAVQPARSREAPVGVTVTGDTAAAVLPAGASIADLDALLRDRGLDPADWHVERVTVNEWDALAHGGGDDGEPRVVKLRQMKAHLRNRRSVIGPAREVARRHRPEPGTSHKAGRLVAVMGDQQAPYHDPDLHRAVLRWLADVQPAELVLTGDTADFPTISRHRDRPRWNASVQECVDASYRLLSDYADAVPNARRVKLRGNHDWRLESELMDRAERMAFVRPAPRGPDDELHLYSVRRLLHLDALGYELAGVEGDDWRFGEHVLAPSLAVRHEPPSAQKAARLNRSVMAGHTHRQGIRHVTGYEGGEPVVRTIVEVGCLALTRGGLGYAPDPDWQPGFATVQVAADGSHSFDLAAWRGGVLSWRGERWKA